MQALPRLDPLRAADAATIHIGKPGVTTGQNQRRIQQAQSQGRGVDSVKGVQPGQLLHAQLHDGSLAVQTLSAEHK